MKKSELKRNHIYIYKEPNSSQGVEKRFVYYQGEYAAFESEDGVITLLTAAMVSKRISKKATS